MISIHYGLFLERANKRIYMKLNIIIKSSFKNTCENIRTRAIDQYENCMKNAEIVEKFKTYFKKFSVDIASQNKINVVIDAFEFKYSFVSTGVDIVWRGALYLLYYY